MVKKVGSESGKVGNPSDVSTRKRRHGAKLIAIFNTKEGKTDF